VDVTAQMVAAVVAVQVEAGTVVQEGQPLLLVESMKMEIPVTAPIGGTVASVHVAVGDVIAEGDLLVRLEPA
jgi:acetyl-CoA carboxylase biotin carboxyl carrier protein